MGNDILTWTRRVLYSFVSRESAVENRLLSKMRGNNRRLGVGGEKQKRVAWEKEMAKKETRGVAGRLRTWRPGVWRAGGARPGKKTTFDETRKRRVKTSIFEGVQRYTSRRRYSRDKGKGRDI